MEVLARGTIIFNIYAKENTLHFCKEERKPLAN